MTSSDGRIDLPELGVSVLPLRVWALAQLPPPSHRHALGVFLPHIPSGILLDVRILQSSQGLPADDFPYASENYFGGQWPGPRYTTTFPTDGGLRGAVAVYDSALSGIPGAIVREWLITDGRRFANASTYATAQQWEDGLLADCEALLRSIRME